jgi:gliding motility-associated-like protein
MNQSTGATDHLWRFGMLDSSSEVHPTYEFPSEGAGTYDVCLLAENAYGCRDSICKEVSIQGKFIFYIPNAFTPDGDGVNDAFYPVVQGADPTDFHFYIYDRWGEVVFEAHSPEKARWDGSVKGDRSAGKTDVYVWRFVTTNKYTGEEVVKEGHVTLIR